MGFSTLTLVCFGLLMSLSCGKENDKSTQQLVAGPPGPVTPSPNPQPNPEKKDFPYSSRVYATSADLPVCTESLKGALAYLMVQKIFQSCDANTWVTVDIGSKQTSSGKALEIFDAENNKIGNLIGPYDISGQAFLGLVFLDGVSLNVQSKLLDNSFFSQGMLPELPECWYKTNDCSGTCFARIANGDLARDISGGVRQVIWSSETFTTGIARYASRITKYGQQQFCGIPTDSGVYIETKAYAPTQFKYPFALPLSVK